MSQEIERKFLITGPPASVFDLPARKIIQGYLDIASKTMEIRLREREESCFLTIKRGNGLNREEIELPLSREQFDQLWPLTEDRRIIKLRRRIPLGDHTIEFDVYEDKFNGLMTAEVEFSDEASARRFQPPSWFGAELTDEIALQNGRLAQLGIPLKLRQKYHIRLQEENVFHQSGAIGIRFTPAAEVLLVTNRKGNKWIFPKGIVGHGLSPRESARKEALEEGGIHGDLTEKIGEYEYRKGGGQCRVEMFLMEQVREVPVWPENFRSRAWVAASRLGDYITQKELQPIVSILQQKYLK